MKQGDRITKILITGVIWLRPKLLEIEGLQSYLEKQKVDFERLGETGLFGIFGPTGSGKSSVLDAITLALYGEVNRALSGTQGIINTSASAVKVLFEFELKKGSSKKTYRVERVYQKKKGTENSCEAKVARLVELREEGAYPLADKPREVTGKVEELIGLRHDDFMRAVVLPQNKFQEFLMLEKAKKREMLERIFYLEEYGRQLTDKVSSRITTVRERQLVVQGELLALGDASDEALKTAEAAMKDIQIKRDKALSEFRLAEASFNQARELWQLVSDLEILENKEKEHLTEAGSIDAKAVLLERAVKAKSLEDIITRFENVSLSLEEIQEKLQPLCVMLPECEKELAEAKQLRDTGVAKANEEKQQLIERKMLLNQALLVKNDISAVTAGMAALRTMLIKTREEITAADRKIEDFQKHIEKLKNDVALKKQQIDRFSLTAQYREEVQAAVKLEESLEAAALNTAAEKKRFDELSAVLEALKERHTKTSIEMEQVQKKSALISEKQALHEQAKLGDRETASSNIGKYHSLKATVSMLTLKKAEIDAILQKAGNLEAEAQKQKELLCGLTESKNKLLEENAAIIAVAAQLREKLQANAAYMLSGELEAGKPCPVCGSVHHPEPASGIGNEGIAGIEEIEEKIKEADKRIVEVAAKIREAENSCTIGEEQIRSKELQLVQLNDEISIRRNEINTSFDTLKKELQEYVDSSSLNCQDDIEQIRMTVEDIGSKNNMRLKAIGDWEALREELNKQAMAVGTELAAVSRSEGAIRAELKANSENLERVEKVLKAALIAHEEKSEQYKVIAGKLGIESAVKESKIIKEKDAKVEELRKEVEKLQEASADEAGRLELVKEQRRQLNEKHATVVNDGKHLKEQKEEKEAKLLELTGNNDLVIEKEIELIDARTIEIGQKEKRAYARVEELDEKVRSLSMQKNILEGQRNTFAASKDEINRALGLLIKEKGFNDIDEAKKNIITTEQTKILEDKIEAYKQTGNNLKAQKAMLLKKLDGHTINIQEWDDIKQSYDLRLTEKDESASAFEVSKNVYLTLKQRHGRWSSLNIEFKTIEHKASMLDHIKSLLKGNSFIEYVAEERLRYIAREASETLGVMTRYRYALELDSDNGFVIRDNANGGVRRPVTSLSGGEVFLTSLSLALALSSQIHLKGQSPLEFFFLDEGFGTLDNTLLDLVIDSLERISNQERVIGLISHVPELKNRISRRLIIEPPDQEGNGSQVRIEKA